MHGYETKIKNFDLLLKQIHKKINVIEASLQGFPDLNEKNVYQLKTIQSHYYNLKDELNILKKYAGKDKGIMITECDESIHKLKHAVSKLLTRVTETGALFHQNE